MLVYIVQRIIINTIMVKKSDGKYNSAYAQASAIWNKEKGGKIVRPKKGTPEYQAIKKIEAKIKATRDALESGDVDEIRKASEELTQASPRR